MSSLLRVTHLSLLSLSLTHGLGITYAHPSPITLIKRDIEYNDMNRPGHENVIQHGSNFISTTTERIPADPSTNDNYEPSSKMDMLVYPQDPDNGSDDSGWDLSSSADMACDTMANTQTVGFMAKKALGFPSEAAPPSDIEGMRSLYTTTFLSINNTQSSLEQFLSVNASQGMDPRVPPHVKAEMVLRYAQYAGLTYCAEESARGMSGVQIPGVPGNTTLLGDFEIRHWNVIEDLQYYMAINTKHKQIILAVRGSDNTENYKRNMKNNLVPPSTLLFPGAPEGSGIHEGFQGALEAILQEGSDTSMVTLLKEAYKAHPDHRLIITGHSLGGAIAASIALFLKLRVTEGLPIFHLYTYGQPILSNGIFADWLFDHLGNDRYIRTISSDDMVPYLMFNAWYPHDNASKIRRHPQKSNEVFLPLWKQPVVQLCNGFADTLCSENRSCRTRSWLHHSWYGGLWAGRAFCLLSSSPQPME